MEKHPAPQCLPLWPSRAGPGVAAAAGKDGLNRSCGPKAQAQACES
jgi:hypothetical protein